MVATQFCLAPNLPALPPRNARAECLHRKMNGSSQASLVSASDGNFYVLKSPANPQGPNVVFNEAFGSMLAEHLGLPTPLWRSIEVDSKFLRENPSFRFETDRGIHQPSPGPCFGSQFVFGPPDGDVYETVPQGWVDRINNPTLFARMLLLDLWAENIDRRQVLFIEQPPRRALDVVFFDHGHMFGGPHGSETLRAPEACLYRHRKIYQKAFQFPKIVSWMISRIESTREAELRILLTRLPQEWHNEKLEDAAIRRLLKNQKVLREKVEELNRSISAGAA